jgi:hypothetical protein
LLYRDDSGPHVGRVAPYEPELETAEGNATEDNILGVEIADDALDEADNGAREAEDDISSNKNGHKIENERSPVKNVVENPK